MSQDQDAVVDGSFNGQYRLVFDLRGRAHTALYSPKSDDEQAKLEAALGQAARGLLGVVRIVVNGTDITIL